MGFVKIQNRRGSALMTRVVGRALFTPRTSLKRTGKLPAPKESMMHFGRRWCCWDVANQKPKGISLSLYLYMYI